MGNMKYGKNNSMRVSQSKARKSVSNTRVFVSVIFFSEFVASQKEKQRNKESIGIRMLLLLVILG